MIDYGPGDLVVCVDDRQHPHYGPHDLKRGNVYVVTQVFLEELPNKLFGSGAGVRVAGAQNSSWRGFSAHRFRKLPRKSQAFWTGEDARVPA